jgi:hypothetical protein
MVNLLKPVGSALNPLQMVNLACSSFSETISRNNLNRYEEVGVQPGDSALPFRYELA